MALAPRRFDVCGRNTLIGEFATGTASFWDGFTVSRTFPGAGALRLAQSVPIDDPQRLAYSAGCAGRVVRELIRHPEGRRWNVWVVSRMRSSR